MWNEINYKATVGSFLSILRKLVNLALECKYAFSICQEMSNECGIITLTLFKYYSVQSKHILCFHEIVVDRFKKNLPRLK